MIILRSSRLIGAALKIISRDTELLDQRDPGRSLDGLAGQPNRVGAAGEAGTIHTDGLECI